MFLGESERVQRERAILARLIAIANIILAVRKLLHYLDTDCILDVIKPLRSSFGIQTTCKDVFEDTSKRHIENRGSQLTSCEASPTDLSTMEVSKF